MGLQRTVNQLGKAVRIRDRLNLFGKVASKRCIVNMRARAGLSVGTFPLVGL